MTRTTPKTTTSVSPLLVHVHVPKCAGTSFNELLHSSFGDRHLAVYDDGADVMYDDAKVEALVREHPDALSIASHSIRTTAAALAGRPALYVTFLRDPLEWFLSNMTYVKKNHARLGEAFRSQFPAEAATMPVRELAARMLEKRSADPTKRSYVARFFSSCVRSANTSASTEDDEAGQAIQALQRFFFVGLVEEMPRSLRILRHRLGEHGLHLADVTLPELNVSRDVRDDLAWLDDPNDPVRQAVVRSLVQDQLVYDYARRRFEQDVRECRL